MRERIEAVLAVIRAHTRRSHSAKRQIGTDQMQYCIVHTPTTKRNRMQHLIFDSFIFSEQIKGKRFRFGIHLIYNKRQIVVFQYR
ncbi:hypothetical protein D3C76_1355390 [compost metagenome]